MRVSTASLAAAGTTKYTVACQAGDYRWSQSYQVVVSQAGFLAPEQVTLATPEVHLEVGEVKTIDPTTKFEGV